MKVGAKNWVLFLCVVLVAFSATAAHSQDILLFSGNASKDLAKAVAEEMEIELGDMRVAHFNDGEINIQVHDNVRNQDVFILQSTCSANGDSVNDHLIELLLMARTMKRSSASSVTAIIPYYGYARQDRKCAPRVPISASDVAMLIEAAGVDRVVAVDLHCGQIQGFFHEAPVDNLFASTVFVPYFAAQPLQNTVIVSPDAGGVTRAKKFGMLLGKFGIDSDLAMLVKQREKAGVIGQMDLIGDVEGCDVIIVDDICDTAGTLCKAAQLLKDRGAAKVMAAITHPVFSDPALDRIGSSVIGEIVIADTIPLDPSAPSNIKQVSVAPLLAEAIKRIYDGESVSSLFI